MPAWTHLAAAFQSLPRRACNESQMNECVQHLSIKHATVHVLQMLTACVLTHMPVLSILCINTAQHWTIVHLDKDCVAFRFRAQQQACQACAQLLTCMTSHSAVPRQLSSNVVLTCWHHVNIKVLICTTTTYIYSYIGLSSIYIYLSSLGGILISPHYGLSMLDLTVYNINSVFSVSTRVAELSTYWKATRILIYLLHFWSMMQMVVCWHETCWMRWLEKVTKLVEDRMLQQKSRAQAYRRYQQTTPMWLPGPFKLLKQLMRQLKSQ